MFVAPPISAFKPRITGALMLATCWCLLAPVTASAATLPPGLVARLSADRDAAQTRLVASRRALAPAAARQREAAADAALIASRVRRVEQLVGLVSNAMPAALEDRTSAVVRRAARESRAADDALEVATQRTAQIQARALDADRRLRALQRAAATEDDRDTTLGSWRFGSGEPSVSAESIDRYLQSKGSPLAGEGAAFLASGVEHEIDPRLLVAIAGAESYFGITTCAPHNAWGWGCPSGPYAFESWSRGIDTVARGLREDYLDDGLTSVGQIHLRYAPPDASNDPGGLNYAWADNVARFLIEQGGDPQDVDGVLGPSR